MTDGPSPQEWRELQRREREWAATEIGKLFWRYERATADYWQRDGAGRLNLEPAHKRMEEARDAFLTALRGF